MFALKGSFGYDFIIPMDHGQFDVHSLFLLRKKFYEEFDDNNVCAVNKLD